MSTNTEQEQPTVESTPTVSNETENPPAANESTTAAEAAPVVEENKVSSWFNNLSMPSIPPNLTNQLTSLSSSFMQVTSKVSAAANTLVQKTLPQRPSTPPPGSEEAEAAATKTEEEQENAQESSELAAGINKDLTRKCLLSHLIYLNSLYGLRNLQ
jgi:hypothetical protein